MLTNKQSFRHRAERDQSPEKQTSVEEVQHQVERIIQNLPIQAEKLNQYTNLYSRELILKLINWFKDDK